MLEPVVVPRWLPGHGIRLVIYTRKMVEEPVEIPQVERAYDVVAEDRCGLSEVWQSIIGGCILTRRRAHTKVVPSREPRVHHDLRGLEHRESTLVIDCRLQQGRSRVTVSAHMSVFP